MRFRRPVVLISALLLAFVAAAPADAARPSGEVARGGPIAMGLKDAQRDTKPSRPRATSNLTYHNGPVMLTNAVYAIYWEPAGSTVQAGYETLIDGYFANVAVATTAAATSNVYYSDTQYYNASGTHISNASVLGGSYVDTNPYPANGCTDRYTTICLSDAQLQTEINRVITVKNWSRGKSVQYFMFTPKGVGSCFGSSCAFTQFCAYHYHLGDSQATPYANMPYADTVPSACDAGQHPNGNDADATINVTSHEHNEAITDVEGTAWYDSQGSENGDKCAWNFGGTLGSTTTGQYNQVIGSGKYYLQQEWSNASTKCVLTGV